MAAFQQERQPPQPFSRPPGLWSVPPDKGPLTGFQTGFTTVLNSYAVKKKKIVIGVRFSWAGTAVVRN